MGYMPGSTFSFDFFIRDGGGDAGFGLANIIPSGSGFIQNGNIDLVHTLSVTNRAEDGRWKVSGTIPSSYAVGDRVSVIVVWQNGGKQDGKLFELGILGDGVPRTPQIINRTIQSR